MKLTVRHLIRGKGQQRADARHAEAAARPQQTAAAREIDELELIYSLPAATSGIARIRQHIRDHEPEGDQP